MVLVGPSGLGRAARVSGRSATLAALIVTAACGAAPVRSAGALGTAAGRIDAAHASAEESVGDLARWIDAFFSDPNYSEEADAYLELAQELTMARHQRAGRRTRVRGRVALPALSERLSLSFRGNNEADRADAAPDVLNDPLNEATDTSSLGLEYFQSRNARLALSVGGGVRFSDQSAYVGPRLRYELSLAEHWNGRLIQRLRYRFGSGIETVSSAQAERGLAGGGLCRERVSVAWKAQDRQDHGVQTTLTSACTLTADERNGLRFAWTTEHRTKPRRGLHSTRISASWRRFVWRRWLFAQFTPFIAWEDAFDWDTRPGIQVTLGMVLEGNPPEPPAEHPSANQRAKNQARGCCASRARASPEAMRSVNTLR